MFPLFMLIIIGLMIVIGIFGVYYALNQMKKAKALIDGQALKRNGTLRGRLAYPELLFPHLDHHVKVRSFGGGKDSPPQTWVEVTLNQTIEETIRIYRESWASGLGKALGLQDIQIGNDQFDNQFIIKGSDEYFVMNLLTFDIQNKLIEIREYVPLLKIRKNRLKLQVQHIPRSEEEYDQLIETVLKVIDRLKELHKI